MKTKDAWINTFFFGKENPTEKEKDDSQEKVLEYMKSKGFDPEKADWSSPKKVLIEHERKLRRN